MNTLWWPRLALLLATVALPQQLELPEMHHLKANETLRVVELTRTEIAEVTAQAEETSFDIPDSWEAEVRARRVSLGGAEGLVLQGTALLCGGTGNCQTWVFRLIERKWRVMFQDRAPVASTFGFQDTASNGIKDLVVEANSSAGQAQYIVYKFDGKFYHANKCYQVSSGGATKRTACK